MKCFGLEAPKKTHPRAVRPESTLILSGSKCKDLLCPSAPKTGRHIVFKFSTQTACAILVDTRLGAEWFACKKPQGRPQAGPKHAQATPGKARQAPDRPQAGSYTRMTSKSFEGGL